MAAKPILTGGVLQELKSTVQACGRQISHWQAEAREVLLRYMVHTADITNPIRPTALSQEWSQRIMQEFFAQACPHRHVYGCHATYECVLGLTSL